ncbi:DUF6173 family protein [Pseudogemmobacter bohemicus]|uniref:DUF6173 family protein n=1 Tax=Pseudogemmobacter bohemicus TaxID=2250708 RepID=UPI000DD40E04|nr:DUF6173 family protein [Pseudogemmobacter bohemicus]
MTEKTRSKPALPAAAPAAKAAKSARSAAPSTRGKSAAGPPAAAPKTAAESACERLVIYIRQFESQLDQSQEIAMGFTGGAAGVLRIEGLGWSAPDLLTFFGQDEDGIRTQMVQHVSQLSVMLRAVPKLSPEAPPVRIGFRLVQGWGGGESGDASVWAGDGG